jgi:hypothetical protein
MSKFTVTKNRLMTMDEVEEALKPLGLPEAAEAFIREQFQEAWDNSEVVNDDGTAACEPQYVGPYVAEEGKLGWGCSHETVFEDLCQAMGLGENLSEEDEDKANQVFDKFFTE